MTIIVAAAAERRGFDKAEGFKFWFKVVVGPGMLEVVRKTCKHKAISPRWRGSCSSSV